MYRWLLDFYHGYLVVMAQGKRLEAFLNSAVGKGIYLWGIRRPAPGRLLFRVRGKDFFLLRSAFRRCGCRGKILYRSGLPFILRRLLRNKGRWLGLVFFITTIQVIASFVWVVGVAVEDGELPGHLQIREELREIGVRPGVLRGRIKKEHERILEELTVAFPEAAWINVELRGVVVLVTMVGKTPPPAKEEGPADIVAAKEGLISELIVLEGTPLAKAGDMVSRGDLLILGEKVLPSREGGFITQPVRAEGIVRARVWYEKRSEEPLEIWRPVRSNRQAVVFSLRCRERLFPFFRRGKVSGKVLWERQTKSICRGRNQVSLVELVKDIYSEVSWMKVRISPEEALARARREAARELSFLLPEAATIKSRREEWETGGDFLVYLLVVETLEDIAQPAASTREKQEDGYDQSHSQGQDQEKTPEDGAWQAVCI
ncbi:MAG TPA: sporulation protein YqfD [Firmicutes bacterium]|jgi:similar to stage IV sporulation protein|nr:sporulation protein YqfD [Bacillota bacterium]